MTDNIFDRLAELLQSSGPVNWKLAVQIAESVAGAADPLDPWVAEEYEELARTATMMVSGGWDLAGDTLPEPVLADPRAWAAANVEGYRYLAEPLAEKLSPAIGGGLEQMLAQLGPALTGMQVGSMAGLMAKTALGQFDAGLPPAVDRGSFLVVPNLETLAAGSGSDVRQVRLWAALSEVVHQAQAAIPWVGGHLSSLFARYLDGLEMNPEMLRDRLGGFEDPEALERMMSEPGGLGGLVAGPEQEQDLEAIRGFLAVLAGHRMATVDRIGGNLLPDLETIEGAAADRHADGGDAGRMLEQLLGIEFDPSPARAAAGFCTEVARRWGQDSVDRIWDGPDSLPSLTELGDPVGWAARVLLDSAGDP